MQIRLLINEGVSDSNTSKVVFNYNLALPLKRVRLASPTKYKHIKFNAIRGAQYVVHSLAITATTVGV